jgi:hypothetical protein
MTTEARGIRLGAALAMSVAACTVHPVAHADAADGAKQVLVLSSTRQDEQFSVVAERELPKLLAEGLGHGVDYYSEYFDLLRFPPSEYQDVYLDFLRRKYAGRHFDLLMLMGDVAVEFTSRHRNVLFGGTPAVFYAVNPPRSRPANSTGLNNPLRLRPSIDLALSLQPDLECIYVVSGAGPSDRRFEELARAEFRTFAGRVEFVYLSGLVTNDLEVRLKTLPPRSAVYYLMVSEDGAGERFQQMAYLTRVAAAANAPTYSWADAAVDSASEAVVAIRWPR